MSQATIIIKAAAGASQASHLFHFFKGSCPGNRVVYKVETDTTLSFAKDFTGYLMLRVRLYVFTKTNRPDVTHKRCMYCFLVGKNGAVIFPDISQSPKI